MVQQWPVEFTHARSSAVLVSKSGKVHKHQRDLRSITESRPSKSMFIMLKLTVVIGMLKYPPTLL